MSPYFEILRPSNSLMTVLAVIVGAVVSGFYNSNLIFIAVLVVFLNNGAGNALNDYFDYKIDKINKPKRPIPSGRMKRETAKNYSLILFLISILLSVFLTFYNVILAVVNMALLILYSWKLKQKVLIGNATISWLVGSTFVFGGLLSGQLSFLIILIFFMAFFANMGREIAKTIEDVKGDKKLGVKTLPIVVGRNASIFLAILFIGSAIILSPLPYVFRLLSINYLYVIIVAVIVFGASCFVLFASPTRSQMLMKVAMVIVIMALFAGTI